MVPGSDLAVPARLPQRFSNATVIGRGSQGLMLAADDAQTGTRVAVKVLELGKVTDWKAFELFERECNALRTLDHPGIPRYHDHFADENAGRYYLVMQYVEGQSLAQAMADERRFTPDALRSMLEQMLDILQYLHTLSPPLVHRDIKPGNIIAGSDTRLHLVDFGGVGKALLKPGGSTMIGTFGYMAPEQMHGEASSRSDLYALASTIAAVASHTPADALPRKGLKLDLSQVFARSRMRDVLDGMLEPDPEQRTQSAAVARGQLRGTSAPAPRADAQALDRVAVAAMVRRRRRSPVRRLLLQYREGTPSERAFIVATGLGTLGLAPVFGPLGVIAGFLYVLLLLPFLISVSRGYRGVE